MSIKVALISHDVLFKSIPRIKVIDTSFSFGDEFDALRLRSRYGMSRTNDPMAFLGYRNCIRNIGDAADDKMSQEPNAVCHEQANLRNLYVS